MMLPDEAELRKQSLEQFVGGVRLFLRDFKELNRLISGEESSNRQIVFAIADTIDDFNTTPPLLTPVGFVNFPSRSLLLRGTVATLLESVGMFQTRNQLSFSDGGMQVGINDKTSYLMSWIQLFRGRYEKKTQDLKVALNIEGGWGEGLHSEYVFANDFYYGLW